MEPEDHDEPAPKCVHCGAEVADGTGLQCTPCLRRRREEDRARREAEVAAASVPCGACGTKPVGLGGADGKCFECVDKEKRGAWFAGVMAQLAEAQARLVASPHRCAGGCGEHVMIAGHRCSGCDEKHRDHTERLTCARDARDALPRMLGGAHFGAPELGAWVRDAKAIALARAVSRSKLERVLLLGKPGVGKSTLAACIARDLAYARKLGDCRWIDAHTLAGARPTAPLGAEATEVELALEADLLVIDDLGSERVIASSAVPEVIFSRHANLQPTIVTCGFGFDAIEARYGGGILRRLTEGAAVIEVGS